jgi:hypothetical protein
MPGDRSVAFWFAPEYFERLAADAGARGSRLDFTVGRIPPLRPLAALVAGAGAAVTGRDEVSWEERGVRLLRRLQLQSRVPIRIRPQSPRLP